LAGHFLSNVVWRSLGLPEPFPALRGAAWLT
jgi:hypothetical protein